MRSKVKNITEQVRIASVGLRTVLLFLFVVHGSVFTADPQTGGTFDLSRSVIASGGEFSMGGIDPTHS